MPEFDGILFSDLHLSPDTTRLNELFEAFVDRVAGTPEVACLGDLAEYWIGADQLRDEHGRRVYDHMRRLAQGTKRAVWVPGNRDFLFSGEAAKAGYRVSRNVYRGDFCGRPVALEHGDRFCTLDRRYQRFRWWFRKIPFRFLGAVSPASASHAFARKVRSKSTGDTARKSPSMFGIQPGRVDAHVARGAELVICGHVHTPLDRVHESGGRSGRLLVLGDWRDDGAVVCVVKDGRFRLARFDGEGFTDYEAPAEQRLYEPQESAG